MESKIEKLANRVCANMFYLVAGAAVIWLGWAMIHDRMAQVPESDYWVALGIAVVVRGVIVAAQSSKEES